MASQAISEAQHLNDIGFPEFTTKLVSDVFDALVSANIRQTESYIALLREVSKSLTAYINDTKDDISGAEILQFLAKVLPPADPSGKSEDATKVKPLATLAQPDVDALKTAVAIQGETPPNTTEALIPAAGQLDTANYNKILDAVANRLAANKYEILQEMVKLGVLRLVVENGVIETRLTFSTYTSSFYQSRSTNYNRSAFDFRTNVGTGGLVSLFAKASTSTSFNTISISTAEKINQDRSGTTVNIFGRVQINFRTDYLPLKA
jgi:hypothetical protein